MKTCSIFALKINIINYIDLIKTIYTQIQGLKDSIEPRLFKKEIKIKSINCLVQWNSNRTILDWKCLNLGWG